MTCSRRTASYKTKFQPTSLSGASGSPQARQSAKTDGASSSQIDPTSRFNFCVRGLGAGSCSRPTQDALRVQYQHPRPRTWRFALPRPHLGRRKGPPLCFVTNHSSSLTLPIPTQNDLTYESYLSTITHDSADAPLTAREAEMAEIRAAEASTVDDAEARAAGRSIIFGPAADDDGEGESVMSPPADGSRREIKGALPWTDEVAETVRRLGGEVSQVGSCAVLVSFLNLVIASHSTTVADPATERRRKSTSRTRRSSSQPNNPKH